MIKWINKNIYGINVGLVIVLILEIFIVTSQIREANELYLRNEATWEQLEPWTNIDEYIDVDNVNQCLMDNALPKAVAVPQIEVRENK